MDATWGETIRIWAGRSFRNLREPPLRMIEKLALVSQHLDPDVDVDKIMRKVRFLYYELSSHAQLGPQSSTDREKLLRLRDYFFKEKAFQCRSPNMPIDEQDYLIHNVMSRRLGSPVTIGLIFRSLAQQIQLNVELVVIENQRLLKFVDGGQCHFLDICRSGELLDKPQLLELLNIAHKVDAALLETLDSEQIFVHYLMGLRKVYRATCADEKLMNVLNLLLSLPSNNIRFLAERAMLRERLGQSYEALLDLKRYFSFYDERQGPSDIVSLYQQLRNRFT